MIKYCLNAWDRNKDVLEKNIKKDPFLVSCDYLYIVQMTVNNILGKEWDYKNITVIDNGDYQGTTLYLIPRIKYQPSAYDYLLTYAYYGSCSGCDTLQAIQDTIIGELTDEQVRDYMMLCKDIVTRMIKPYNNWLHEEEFDEVKFE